MIDSWIKFNLIVLFSFFSFPVKATSQEKNRRNVVDERIDIPISSATLSDWFALIEKENIILSYNSSKINLNKRVEVSPHPYSVGNLLHTILSDYSLLLIPVGTRKLILQIEQKRNYFIAGVVKEESSDEKLYGAVVRFTDKQNNRVVATTRENGSYGLKLMENVYSMEVSYMGYVSYRSTIKVKGNRFFTTALKSLFVKLPEVIVKPQKGMNEWNETLPSSNLSFSNTDLFSTIMLLPGVMVSSVTGEFHVNGGSSDENLILLDGVPIYHPSKTSILPPFNGDALKKVTFYKNNFPSKFEGRLSSVTDVELKEGNKQKHAQTVSLAIPSLSLMLEGPILKNRLSYMLSARRSWLDILNGKVSDEFPLSFSFYDFNLKLSYDLNLKTALQATIYRSSEKYESLGEENEKGSSLGSTNQLYILKSNSLWKNGFSTTNTIAYSNYLNKMYDAYSEEGERKNLMSSIKELSFTSQLSYNVATDFTASCAIKGSFEDFKMEVLNNVLNNRAEPIAKLSFFYDNKIRLLKKIHMQIGVNSVVYLPSHHKNYYSLQPRFLLKYLMNDRNMFHVGFSKMTQFYHILRINTLLLPDDFRVPSIYGVKPRISNQYEASWKHFLKNGFLKGSIYYKKRKNVIAFRPMDYLLASTWMGYVMVGNGESYGLDLRLYQNWRKFTCQLSYAFSRSKEWFDSVKSSKKFASLYDVPHAFNGALSYKASTYSRFSASCILHSGRVLSIIDGYPAYIDQFRSKRTPFYYQIGVSYSYSKTIKKNAAKLLLRLGVYNIIGNSSDEDLMDVYSINMKSKYQPYMAIIVKF